MRRPAGVVKAFNLEYHWQHPLPVALPQNECEALFERYVTSFVPEHHRAQFRKIFARCDETILSLPVRDGEFTRSDEILQTLGLPPQELCMKGLWFGLSQGGGVSIRGDFTSKKFREVFTCAGDAIAVCEANGVLYGLLWPHSESIGVLSRVKIAKPRPAIRRHG